VGTLSGGNKRKLSVTIALCGESKLVLLDEPTAGMDLGARRALWDMLKNYRRDKIIILTTHIWTKLISLVIELVLWQKVE